MSGAAWKKGGAMDEDQEEDATAPKRPRMDEPEDLDMSGASDTLVIGLEEEQHFQDDEQGEELTQREGKKRAAAYDEVLPQPEEQEKETQSSPETKRPILGRIFAPSEGDSAPVSPVKAEKVPLARRLNLRSRPPVPARQMPVERDSPESGGEAALRSSSVSPKSPLAARPSVPKWSLRERLNQRSRPVVLPPTVEGRLHQTPPRPAAAPVDPNRTPERPSTPPSVMARAGGEGEAAEEDEDDDGPLDASFAASVTFSPNVTQDLNASFASAGGGSAPGFSSGSDEETGEEKIG